MQALKTFLCAFLKTHISQVAGTADDLRCPFMSRAACHGPGVTELPDFTGQWPRSNTQEEEKPQRKGERAFGAFSG